LSIFNAKFFSVAKMSHYRCPCPRARFLGGTRLEYDFACLPGRFLGVFLVWT